MLYQPLRLFPQQGEGNADKFDYVSRRPQLYLLNLYNKQRAALFLLLVCKMFSTHLHHRTCCIDFSCVNGSDVTVVTVLLLFLQLMNFLKKMAGNEYVGFSNAT